MVEYRAEADLLHPLATLHWERCHTWRAVYPTHCAVLHDRVAILTRSTGSNDVLHISSTDLHSWTTTTLPYKDMSLTTYQSMFVAVGGRHPSTDECTDLLFTSDTGLQWQPSLPPMPIKRSHTSSVSTRSPEVLVVAGGKGSGGRNLDVVELLLGDQWSTVDLLPAPCNSMHSTLHDGNLYFMGGREQGDTVYTCSCTSLISSCGTNTTTDRPLWRQFKAPSNYTAAVSYSSCLVSIDCWRTIRAYSSVSQSWVEVTSTGYSSHGRNTLSGFSMAAAVLPTGELVYALDYDGVHKIKLSEFRCVTTSMKLCSPQPITPTNDDVALTSSLERMLGGLGNSNLDAFMSVYADLVVAVEPSVNTVADQCHSMGLISKDVYDTIIQRDLIRADKARILLSTIRDAISRNEESLHQFTSALNKAGDFEYLVQKLEKYLNRVSRCEDA